MHAAVEKAPRVNRFFTTISEFLSCLLVTSNDNTKRLEIKRLERLDKSIDMIKTRSLFVLE